MDDLCPDRLPLIPDEILRAHQVSYPLDTRFRSSARLLQSIWRDRQGMPSGMYTDGRGRRRKLGSRLAPPAAARGGNFLSADISRLVRRELAYREPGALIEEERVWANLLSSMPLAFNLFGLLKLDRELAGRVVANLFPELAGEVCHVQFEHSPARGDLAFTADNTAFDVFISCRTAAGAKTFIAIEVKYSEAMTEPEPRMRARYDDLSVSSDLYTDADDPALRRNPLQQLWREHMLAQSLVQNGLYDSGVFVLVAPHLNNDVQRAALAYSKLLAVTGGTAAFMNVTLEDVIGSLKGSGAPDQAEALSDRYCDFRPVHALI